ncbi:hypothetical protein PsorP6_016031 [Peronosclerospora sorghi]|uniref:Uncharacterized protein n=1 Tax=Peronosclerospora sorghi TaxID=230839 RepID=A0ACC0WMA9_9STRA|nr:hypothetical protein PsorP6_016031 [Peronosclerospora sorghi]
MFNLSHVPTRSRFLMPFPVLSRRHVAKAAARIEWRSPEAAPSIKTLIESTPSLPQRNSRSESLRSTWLTNTSDSMADNDQDLDQTVIPEDKCSELQPFVQLHQPLSDWVYWQRDAVALPNCWTRVFAVFCDNLLWLYRYEDASARSLLVRMRVTALSVGANPRELRFRDTVSTSSVQLCLPDPLTCCRWQSYLNAALAQNPVVTEVETAAIVSKVTSSMQKKSYWKTLAAAAVFKRAKYQSAGHDENAIMLSNRQNRKSLSERWKNVRIALKSALKLQPHYPQLQV